MVLGGLTMQEQNYNLVSIQGRLVAALEFLRAVCSQTDLFSSCNGT